MKSPAVLTTMLLFLWITPGTTEAQLETSLSEDLERWTPSNPYERLPDGRPRVPEKLLQELREVSVEQAWDVLRAEGYHHQWEGDWKIVHGGVKLVGRALTARFMPTRPDLVQVIDEVAAQRDLARAHNLRVIDSLDRDDVAVIDLFGKISQGTFVGGNLATSVFARTGTGVVVDGAIRDIEEVQPLENFVAYVRDLHPSAMGEVMLTGINVPVRIGSVTVLPGDVVLGDEAGVIFIPPHLVEKVVESSKKVRLKDEFTKKTMLSGKYHPSDVYPVMSPEVEQEFQEWLKQQQD